MYDTLINIYSFFVQEDQTWQTIRYLLDASIHSG